MSDDSAFEAFVRANATGLLRTAFLLTGSHHAAEDLLQDTLTALYPRWERVDKADAPLAYVRKSVANRFLSGKRLRSSHESPMWELPDGWDGRDLGEAVADRQMLWQMLGTLPERQRVAIVMRYFHDLTDQQIADLLECRLASVRSLISRGVGAMRSHSLTGLPTSDGTEARQ